MREITKELDDKGIIIKLKVRLDLRSESGHTDAVDYFVALALRVLKKNGYNMANYRWNADVHRGYLDWQINFDHI